MGEPVKFQLSILMCLLVCSFAGATRAATLEELGDPPQTLLPIDVSAPQIPCDEVLDALLKYKDMNRQHEDSVSGFLSQAVDKINGWYETLLPFENGKKPVTAGTFEPVRSGAEKMSLVVDYSYDNSALLASELDRIIVSMRACRTSSAAPKQ